MTNKKYELRDLFSEKMYDVENGLSLYAYSNYSIPAKEIYNSYIVDILGENVTNCHVYMIGFVPKVDHVSALQAGQKLILDFEILGETKSISMPLGPDMNLIYDGDLWYLSDGSEKRYGPTEIQMSEMLRETHGPLAFKVVYVGQAYGTDGSRHALDRLKSHSTLQKIALAGAPEGHIIQTLLIEVKSNAQLLTFFNPFAKDKTKSDERIKNGLDKLFDTNQHEQITLYEAAFIKYFQPHYNKEFKDSFPSTNLKVLTDCYDKDFSSLVAEFCFDDPPFLLWSDAVECAGYHMAKFDLHEENDRKVFFAAE